VNEIQEEKREEKLWGTIFKLTHRKITGQELRETVQKKKSRHLETRGERIRQETNEWRAGSEVMEITGLHKGGQGGDSMRRGIRI